MSWSAPSVSPASRAATTSGQLAGGAKLLDQRVGAGRGEKLVEERVDGSARPRPGELGHDPAVPERLHRRNAADREPLREALVGVDVDLDQRDGTCPRFDRGLEHGREGMARAAPLGPEVDEHRPLRGPRDHVGLERLLGHVHAVTLPQRATTSAVQPAISAASTCSGATPASERWSGSISIAAHSSSWRARAPSADPISSSCAVVRIPRPPGLAPCDPLELAELLEWVDPHVRVRPDAERDRAVEDLGDAQESVAEIGLGRRAGADARSGGREEIELVVVRMRGVDDGRPLAEAARVGEELDRAAAVLLEALLDLARLLVGVDVEWQLLAPCVGADLLEPGARAGADGVGGDPDGDSRRAERLDLLEVGGDAGLAHAVEAAALVGDVEQHDRDPGRSCRLGGGKRLCGAEVVELSHGGVAGGAHLAVDVGVVLPDGVRASPDRLPRASRRATSRSRCRQRGRAARAGTRDCGC